MTQNEIDALIRLLDDPDNEIFKIVHKKLLVQGQKIVPQLEILWSRNSSKIFHQRIEDLIESIHYHDIKKEMNLWANQKENDLLTSAWLLSRYQYRDLEKEYISEKIDKLRQQILLEMSDSLTNLQKIRVINHILYTVHQFTGNPQNQYAPQNCFLNNVLEQKIGNHITISILYLILGQQLGLPIYGINLPKNFILAFVEKSNNAEKAEVLFYINPLNKGAVLGRKEIDMFLEKNKIPPTHEYYKPCTNNIVIQRLMLRMIQTFTLMEKPEKVADMKNLFNIFPEKIISKTDY